MRHEIVCDSGRDEQLPSRGRLLHERSSTGRSYVDPCGGGRERTLVALAVGQDQPLLPASANVRVRLAGSGLWRQH